MSKLLHSRAFWTAVVDTITGLLTLLGGQFWPNQAQFISNLWKTLQPVVGLAILLLATDEFVVPAIMQGIRSLK